MANKVVIGDLVVKVSVDSKDATRQIRQLKKLLNRTNSRGNSAEDKERKKKETSLRNSEIAARKEQRLLRAVGREGELREIRRERAKMAALQRQSRVLRDIGRAESRRAQRLQQAEIRHARIMQRNTNTRNNMIRNGIQNTSGFASNISRGAGMGVLGAGGIAAAGVASATQLTSRYRVSEQLADAAYEERGVSGEEAQERKDKLYRQARNYNLDPKAILGNIGQIAINTPQVETDTVEKLVVSMGIIGKSMGVSNTNMQRSFVGLQQFMVSQTAENLNQMTESMPIMVESIARAMGVTKQELLTAKGGGTLAKLYEKAGGAEAVSSRLANFNTAKGNKLFEKSLNKLPHTLDTFANQFQHSILMFGTNAENGVIDFVRNLSDILVANEDLFIAAGEWLGIAFEVIAESFKEAMVVLQPYIDDWIKSWNLMSDEEKAKSVKETLDQIGEAVKALGAVFATAKVVGLGLALTALGASISGFAATVALATGAGAAGGTGNVVAKTAAKAGILGTLAYGASELLASPVKDYVKNNPDSYLSDFDRNAGALMQKLDTWASNKADFLSSAFEINVNLSGANIYGKEGAEELGKAVGESLNNNLQIPNFNGGMSTLPPTND